MADENKTENIGENPKENAEIIVTKSISELTIDSLKNINFLMLPKKDRDLKQVYYTYKTSEDTLNLLSEQNRTLFADHLLVEERKNAVRDLFSLAIDIVAQNFKGNAKEIDDNLDELTRNKIWNLVDVDLPILQTININSDLYWQRVFECKSRNKFKIGQEKTDQLSWKCLGMSEKIKEIFEDQTYEGWIDENMIALVRPLAQFIFCLRFTQLLPIKEHTYDRDPNLIECRMINYSKNECHHINLEIVGELYELTYLSFEFSPPTLGAHYHSRYFDFSILDMNHLANGLTRLQNLTTFKIRNSRMNNKKLEILIEALKNCPLEYIDFSYCQLNDECGYTLCKLLGYTKSLQSINLSGNYLSAPGMSSLSYGIQEFEGHLKYLDLSRNPISDAGIIFLARAIYKMNQIEILNLCGIQITQTGCAGLPNILEHEILKNINITALPIGEILGDDIVSAIDMNKNILKFEYGECDLTLDQELKIKILIERNNYMHENPYIGMAEITLSKENLPDEEVHKIKNRIYLKAMEQFEKQQECNELLTENYRKALPEVNTHFMRYSVQAQKILTEGGPPVLADKTGKLENQKQSIRISEAKYYKDRDDAEVDFIKKCLLSKIVDWQYFEA